MHLWAVQMLLGVWQSGEEEGHDPSPHVVGNEERLRRAGVDGRAGLTTASPSAAHRLAPHLTDSIRRTDDGAGLSSSCCCHHFARPHVFSVIISCFCFLLLLLLFSGSGCSFISFLFFFFLNRTKRWAVGSWCSLFLFSRIHEQQEWTGAASLVRKTTTTTKKPHQKWVSSNQGCHSRLSPGADWRLSYDKTSVWSRSSTSVSCHTEQVRILFILTWIHSPCWQQTHRPPPPILSFK